MDWPALRQRRVQPVAAGELLELANAPAGGGQGAAAEAAAPLGGPLAPQLRFVPGVSRRQRFRHPHHRDRPPGLRIPAFQSSRRFSRQRQRTHRLHARRDRREIRPPGLHHGGPPGNAELRHRRPVPRRGTADRRNHLHLCELWRAGMSRPLEVARRSAGGRVGLVRRPDVAGRGGDSRLSAATSAHGRRARSPGDMPS